MTVFDTIYRDNRWNGVESLSGPGSGSIATQHVARAIVDLVAELGVTSVLDIGCGDGYWMPDLPGYVGVDVVPEAIERARARHPEREYILLGQQRLYGVYDLAVTRDVMQHLSLKAGNSVLDVVYSRVNSGGYLLASTYVGGDNVNIRNGGAYSPNLEAPPFNMGPPERLIFDGYHYHETDELRDTRKHLGLWRL